MDQKTHPSARLERLPGYRKVRDGTTRWQDASGWTAFAASVPTLMNGSPGWSPCPALG